MTINRSFGLAIGCTWLLSSACAPSSTTAPPRTPVGAPSENSARPDLPTTPPSAVESRVSSCDLRKTDWKNMRFPAPANGPVGAFQLRDGHASDVVRSSAEDDAGRGHEMNLETAQYGDIEGKGALQAFVKVAFTPIGFQVVGGQALYVFVTDERCAARSLGTLEEGKIVGGAYVDGNGGQWRVVDGKLVTTAAPPAPSAPASTPVAASPSRDVCGLQKIDWKNSQYPALDNEYMGVKAFKLRNGSVTQRADAKHGYTMTFKSVQYGDIEGKGVQQALVHIGVEAFGETLMPASTLYVFGGDDRCAVHALGSFGFPGGDPQNPPGKLAGNLFQDQEGNRWRVADRKLQQVK